MNLKNRQINLVIIHRHGEDAAADRAADRVQLIKSAFETHGCHIESGCVYVAGDGAPIQPKDSIRVLTVVCAVGGDGTFATACRDFASHGNAIIVGFQEGNLNFLNAFQLDNINAVFADDVKVSTRRIGEFTTSLSGSRMHFANDVVLRPASEFTMDEYEVRDSQDRFIMAFKGDGLLMSTPMGSTAYNISAGGPILHPTLDAMIITPMYPTRMSSRPTIVPAEIGLKITTKSDNVVLADGILAAHVHVGDPKDEIEISSGGTHIRVLLPQTYSFFQQAHEKLGWMR